MKFPNIVDIDDARSYATEANLEKALLTFGMVNIPRVVVRNRAGRFTAIFTHGRVEAMSMNHMFILSKGFPVIS